MAQTPTQYWTATGLSALVRFGINPLTGEACAFGQRVLCDLNEEGVALLSDFLGIAPTAFPENWNTSVDEKPAIASVMLTRSSWADIAIFAATREGALAMAKTHDDGIMFLYDEESVQRARAIYEVLRLRPGAATTSIAVPRVGSRNVHIATSRVN